MNIIDLIRTALMEDNPTTDITSDLLLPDPISATAHIVAKSHGIFFGHPILDALREINSTVSIDALVQDGQTIVPGDVCIELSGSLNAILEIERTLLNFLQRLSGISTTTARYVSALSDPTIDIMDTRKTTPGFRHLEKQAVKAGGGVNHRFGLHDMVLVKENHLHLYHHQYGLTAFNEKLHSHKEQFPSILIEVEVPSIDVLSQLSLGAIDIVMFDNMSMPDLLNGIEYVNKHPSPPLKEVSGNIQLDTISQYQGIDIDRISIGSLTHSVNALDLSLLVV